jgi:hypothetical protein
MMKKILFSAAAWGLAVTPALAGDGGGLDGAGALLIQAIGRMIGKLTGTF